MGYKKAANILPEELVKQIQEYVDGETIYIPRISENKKEWGSQTSTRQELRERNRSIYQDHLAGIRTEQLAEKYYLSPKSIQRIIGEMKKQNKTDADLD